MATDTRMLILYVCILRIICIQLNYLLISSISMYLATYVHERITWISVSIGDCLFGVYWVDDIYYVYCFTRVNFSHWYVIKFFLPLKLFTYICKHIRGLFVVYKLQRRLYGRRLRYLRFVVFLGDVYDILYVILT